MISNTKEIFKNVLDYGFEGLGPSSLYPVAIIKDRYDGLYSKGKYLAFKCDIDYLPLAVDGSEETCKRFWETEEKINILIGKGDSPNLALLNLYEKFKKHENNKASHEGF